MITVSSGAKRNESRVNIRFSEPRNRHRAAAYAAGSPITSDSATAPSDTTRLFTKNRRNGTPWSSPAPSTVRYESRVGVNEKYVLNSSFVGFSDRTTIQATGNSAKTK